MKSTIKKSTYKAIYRLLDRVSPVDGDCGKLCGAACCTCTYEPEDFEFNADSDVNADEYMGIYLLPGEEKIHKETEPAEPVATDWIDWGYIMAEDYEFPDSWHGKVHFIRCKTPPICPRHSRPIQCRTFPLAPHIDEDGELHLIMHCDELPYSCPLIDDGIELNYDFVKATHTVWKHLIRDPYICDLILWDSECRMEEACEIQVVI